jgi:hypothetical protein
MINNLRGSLINLFYIKPKEGARLENIYYFSETTSRLDFQHWVKNMTSNLYNSHLYDAERHYKPDVDGKDDGFAYNMPNNFFSQKCMFLGPPIMIKFDTKLKGGGKSDYFIQYNEQTMSKFSEC